MITALSNVFTYLLVL